MDEDKTSSLRFPAARSVFNRNLLTISSSVLVIYKRQEEFSDVRKKQPADRARPAYLDLRHVSNVHEKQKEVLWQGDEGPAKACFTAMTRHPTTHSLWATKQFRAKSLVFANVPFLTCLRPTPILLHGKHTLMLHTLPNTPKHVSKRLTHNEHNDPIMAVNKGWL